MGYPALPLGKRLLPIHSQARPHPDPKQPDGDEGAKRQVLRESKESVEDPNTRLGNVGQIEPKMETKKTGTRTANEPV